MILTAVGILRIAIAMMEMFLMTTIPVIHHTNGMTQPMELHVLIPAPSSQVHPADVITELTITVADK